MFVLTLAGVGRGLSAASDMTGPVYGIPGVTVEICHTGSRDDSIPAGPVHHDCCDACTLLAPITLSDAPSLTAPASVVHFVEHVQALAWVPTLARLRTPRQSQGPPAA